MKLRIVHSLALAGLLGVNFCLTAGTRAVSPAPTGEARKSRAPQRAISPQTPAPAEPRHHPGGVDSLVENSKRAIIETGISESYFEKHFKLVKALNEPADRRVEWSYSVDEYEALLVDAIGFHTTGGSRTHIHGIKNQLYSTHEIVKTMPRARARKILRSCIGVFDGETTTYRALTVPGTARLYLTGRSRVIKQDRVEGAAGGKTFKFFYIGFVDVESGKCVKKVAKVRS